MMQHKYLPHVVAGVLLPLWALVSLGCSDSTGPSARTPSLLLSLETPPSDLMTQLAVALTAVRSDSALLKTVRIYVDSGAGTAATSATPLPWTA